MTINCTFTVLNSIVSGYATLGITPLDIVNLFVLNFQLAKGLIEKTTWDENYVHTMKNFKLNRADQKLFFWRQEPLKMG